MNGQNSVLICPCQTRCEYKFGMQMKHKNSNTGVWKFHAHILSIGIYALLGLTFHTNLQADEKENIDYVTPYYLEDVIVTAERRETDAQKTPISITTFTAEEIDELNITGVADVVLRTPGLTIGNTANMSFPELYMRGIGTKEFSVASDLSIGFYVDDVYIGRAATMVSELFDLERVEILKGPQGTLWGRNAVGGAIHVVTAEPTDEFTTKHQLTYGNFDLFRLAGSVSGPIIDDSVQGKLSYSVRNRDGYADNVFDDSELADAENVSLRGSLRFLPTGKTDLLLSLDYSTDRPTGVAFNPVITGAPANTFGHVEPEGPFNVNHDTASHEHRDIYGVSARLNWEVQDLSFVSISAVRGFNLDLLDDTDGLSVKVIDFIQDTDQYQFTQELRLQNHDDVFEWLLGAYLFHEQSDDRLTLDGISTNLSEVTSNSYSLFGQASYHFTDRVSATFGARTTYENKDFDTQRLGAAAYALTKLDEDWSAFTPKFGLQFQQTDDLLYYASVSRGFRSGGYSTLTEVQNQEPFDPEFVTAYEIGMKSKWFDRRLQTNLAGFYYNHKDLQVTKITAGNQVITTNAAEAREMGLEMDMFALLSERFELNANLSLIDAEYKEFINISSIDVSGNKVNNTPSFSTNLGFRYSIPVKEYGSFSIGAEHQYQSEIFFTETNESLLSQGGYHNFNARIEFETYNEKFKISAFGNNLTDEETVNTTVDLRAAGIGVVEYAFNPPRTFGVAFTYNH